MARDITVSFDDGSQHLYQGAPDDVTPAQIQERAQKDFGKKVTALDGGRKAAPAPRATPLPTPEATETEIPTGAPPQGTVQPQPPQPEPEPTEQPSGMMGALKTVGRAVGAAVETPLAIGSGATTGFLGGLLSMGNRVAQQITGIVQGKSADEIKAQGPSLEGAFTQGMQAGTYQPRTEAAQEQVGNIGETLQTHGPSVMGIGPELGALGTILKRGARPAAAMAADTAGAAVTPKISPQRAVNVRAGIEQGIVPAPHQLAENKYVKKLGETAESVPLAGGAANKEARLDAFHEALAKQINPEAEGETHITPDVMKTAMDRSGTGIGDITSAHSIPSEEIAPAFAALRRQLKRASPDNAHIVGGYIDEFERIAEENGGVIPGENFKSLNSELGQEIRANAGNPTGHLLSSLQDDVMDAFRNQLSPEVRPQYDAFRAQYAKAKTILPLMAKSVEGRIAPGDLMGAINATKAGKNAMALGYAGELGDLARAGKYLTDSKSSGTAELSLIHKFILDPLKGAAKVATILPAAKLYNKMAPGITKAMVRRGLANAPEGMTPEVPGGAPPETPPTGPAGGPGPAPGPTRQQVLDAAVRRNDAAEQTRLLGMSDQEWEAAQAKAALPATDPRLAEIAKLREGATDPAVQAALDAHEKTVQADLKTKAAAAKQAASVDALEAAAKATQDPDLRATLQKQADKLRGEKIPVGEATELAGTPTPKPEKVGKIPVGKVVEGQPALPAEKPGPIPTGAATEITPEVIAPEEPIPVGEATDVSPVSNRPAGEVVSNVPKAEPVSNRSPTAEPVSNVPQAEAGAYAHRALFDEAVRRGIQVEGRRPSEVRNATQEHIAKEHGLNPMDMERAKAVAQALDIDEQAVEAAATQHDKSPRAFDRAIDDIIQQGTENAFETKQAANSSEGPAPNPPTGGGQGGAGPGRGGKPNGNPERPSGATGTGREPTGTNRPAAAGTHGEGNQPSGQAEAIPIGDVIEGAPETQAANNASGESEASSEAINRAVREKAAGQERVLIDRDGTVRPLIGPSAVDQVARPGQVVAQKGVGAKEWTVLSSGADMTKGGIARALSKVEARGPRIEHTQNLSLKPAMRAGMNAVVDFMNGDIDKPALIKKLAEQKLPEGVLHSITNRLEDQFTSGDVNAVLKMQEPKGFEKGARKRA